MNISKILALRYIKRQKRRTIITILGIVLSVALFTAIGTMLASLQHYQTSRELDINGGYEVQYSGITLKDIAYLNSNYNVNKVGTSISVGNAFLNKDEAKRYISGDTNIRAYTVYYYDSEALKINNMKLKKGTFPKDNKHVVLTKMFNKLGYKVNDKIKIYVLTNGGGDLKEKEFIISGFLDYNYNTILFPKEVAEKLTPIDKKYISFVNMKKGVNYNKSFRTIEKQIKCEDVMYNYGLLELEGNYNNKASIYGMAFVMFILGVVILVSSALVVYSAFNISIFERVKEFGILRSVGASNYQIKSVIFIEAFIMIILGIPLGVLCGIAAIKILFLIVTLSKFSMFVDINIYISSRVIVSSIIFGVLCIIFSSIVPVIKSGGINPIEAIRGTGKTKALNKRSYFNIIKKINFQTFLTFRNIKRNKGRFRLVVSSVAVSVVIFIVFNSFMFLLFQFMKGPLYIKDFNISSRDITFKKEDIYAIKDIKGVKDVYPMEETSRLIFCPFNRLSKEFKQANKKLEHKDGYFWSGADIYFAGYDLNELNEVKDYVIKGKIDIEKLNSGEEVLAFEKIKYRGVGEEINETNLNIGDEIYIDNNRVYGKADPAKASKLKFNKLKKVKVGAIVSKNLSYYNNNSAMFFISSTEGYKNIIGHDSFDEFQVEVDKGANKEEVRKKIDSKLAVNYKYILQDEEEIESQYKQYKIETIVLVYGFIAVISLIGILNVINTVNTNLMLRLKEFACLISVGMSIHDLKKMLLTEGILYGAYGVFYGLLVGSGLYYLIYKEMMNTIPSPLP